MRPASRPAERGGGGGGRRRGFLRRRGVAVPAAVVGVSALLVVIVVGVSTAMDSGAGLIPLSGGLASGAAQGQASDGQTLFGADSPSPDSSSSMDLANSAPATPGSPSPSAVPLVA